MKKTLLICFISFLDVTNVFAQIEINKSLIKSSKSDTVAKKIVGNAYLRVYYSLNYKPNPKSDCYIHTETFLQVGKHTTRFMDYNKFRADSISDINEKNGKSAITYMKSYIYAIQRAKFGPLIITGYPEGKVKFQQHVVSSKIYEYKEDIPEIKWMRAKADTIIKKYKCKKAFCEYRGRHYIAWYTEKIDLPLGPYIFRGLPGLIVDIRDTRSHYVFKLNGIQKIKKKDPIYLTPESNVVRTTRANVRKMQINYHNNPTKAFVANGKVKLDDEIIAETKSLPYNPIELE